MQRATTAYSSSSTGRLGVIAVLSLLALLLFTISSNPLGSSDVDVSEKGTPRHAGSSPKVTEDWVSNLVKSEVQVRTCCVCVMMIH